jgi:hypothetical protein
MDKFIDDFRAGKFHVDAVDMELTQNRSDEPFHFKGKGFVEQDDDGALRFKIYVTETDVDKFAHLSSKFNVTAGKLFDNGEYYTLTLVASDGERWTTPDILPNANWPADAQPILSGSLQRIHHVHDTRSPDSVMRVYFFEEVQLPVLPATDTSPAKTELLTSGDCAYQIIQTTQGVIVEATTGAEFPPHLDTRLQESLKFLTAKPLLVRAVTRQDRTSYHIELFSPAPKSTSVQMFPPISPAVSGYYQHAARMFVLYLDFLLANTPHPYWNHVTYYVHNATEASANSIDAWALSLSVAVEGLCNFMPFEISKEEKAKVSTFRRWILAQVKGHDQYVGYAQRVEGLLSMMGKPTVKQRLEHLAASGHIDVAFGKAWNDLRNSRAHPKVEDLNNLSSDHNQKVFDLIGQVTSLMYQIVFHLIGYEGPYMDYGIHNYPTRQYPMAKTIESSTVP